GLHGLHRRNRRSTRSLPHANELALKHQRRVFICAVHKNEAGDAARISIDIHPRDEAADGVTDQHDLPLDTGSLEEQVQLMGVATIGIPEMTPTNTKRDAAAAVQGF